LKALNAKLDRDRVNLAKYFAHDLVDKILKEEMSTDLGGAEIEATIMFFDIRGSTTLAERIGAKAYTDFVNNLFEDIMQIIFDEGGSVNELLGDGILATFGCPDPTSKDASNSVRAALGIRECVQKFNSIPENLEVIGDPVRYGMGIATGHLFSGNIGCHLRLKYAVMGDPVNLASRLEHLTKNLDTDLIMDGNTAAKLPPEMNARKLGRGRVRGKNMLVDFYTVDVSK